MPRFCPDHGQLFRNRIKEGLSTIRKEYLDGTNTGCKNGPGPGTSERPYYHDFAWAYDLLQTDPIAPRVDFIEGVLRAQGIHADSAILDGGCGTGRIQGKTLACDDGGPSERGIVNTVVHGK
jgi:hypothetical protein